jgi:hypothetical protein
MKNIYGILLGIAFILKNTELYEAFEKVKNYSPKISEPQLKQNFKHNKTFYQNNFIEGNKSYYNKEISRSEKKTRRKYISIQCEARHRRQKIKKTLEKKI